MKSYTEFSQDKQTELNEDTTLIKNADDFIKAIYDHVNAGNDINDVVTSGSSIKFTTGRRTGYSFNVNTKKGSVLV